MLKTLLQPETVLSLQARLANVQQTDVARWGVMDATEMLCHLRGAFRVALGELRSAPIKLSLSPEMLKTIALWSPLPWKRNFETLPILKRGMPAMQSHSFLTDQAEVLAEFQRFIQHNQSFPDHAYFGSMSRRDWMRWGYLHTDHHLVQFGR